MKHFLVVLVACLCAALCAPAVSSAANPWRTWFNARMRIRTYSLVEHKCQVTARRLSIQTRHLVLCKNPDPSHYPVFNTGWRKGAALGWFDVEWVRGPQDGLRYRYEAYFPYRGTLFKCIPDWVGERPWYGPRVVS